MAKVSLLKKLTRFPNYRQALEYLTATGMSTKKIAFGVAVGNFVGILPFLGLHTVMGMAAAYILRLNQVVVFLGTQVANPITFPFILVLSAQIGSFVLTGTWLEIKVHDVSVVRDYLYPLLLGSVILGLAVGTVFYFVVYWFVQRYRA